MHDLAPLTPPGAVFEDPTAGPGRSGEPRLLVSVRNAPEALSALAGGADVVDVKEPSRGALGMADPCVIAEVIRAVAASQPSVPVSAALGETQAWLDARAVPVLPPGLALVKLGLSGMAPRRDWSGEWLAVRRRFEHTAGRPLDWIAAAYADHGGAGSPPVLEVIRTAADTGCRGVLVDTWAKQDRGLRGWASDEEIRGWIRAARSAGLLIALAGRLNAHDLCALSAHGADLFGVRSAACAGQDRAAAIAHARVADLRAVLGRAEGERLRRVAESADMIRRRWGRRPAVGIILGTGLGGFEEAIDPELRLDYAQIPHFAPATAHGHAGRLVCGLLDGLPLVVLAGRWHLYEGYSVEQITFPVRVLQRLGIERLIVSNAAGGLNPRLTVGDLVLIDDHIDLTFSRAGAAARRHFDLSGIYDPQLLAAAVEVARCEGIPLQRGAYAAVTGPNYETRAEYRMYRRFGADVIGMSTVPEATAAAEVGLPVLAFSTVTNVCNPDAPAGADGQSVAAAACAAEWKLRRIVRSLLKQLPAPSFQHEAEHGPKQ